jgi:uncharacterized protein with FMN-binding domain
MKKNIKAAGFILIPLSVAAVVYLGYMVLKLQQEEQQLRALTIQNIDIERVKNGKYPGECTLELKKAKVNVTVENGVIMNIEIIEHTHGPGRGAYAITEEIIRKQDLDVDAVSGATKSSLVMKKAVEDALKKGL